MIDTKLTSLLLVVAMLCCCKSSAPDYYQIAKTLNIEMEDAFKKADMKKIASIYADDGYLLSLDRTTIHGRAAIDAYWERWHTPINWDLDVIEVSKNEQDIYESDYWKKMPKKPKHWKEEVIEIGNADVFYQLGHSKIEYESDDGMHRTYEVDFIIVWKKEVDGNYKIWIDTCV